ncbi:hypothetical protein [Achromobacter aloeverae]
MSSPDGILKILLGATSNDDDGEPPFKPATLAQARALMHRPSLSVGDYVVLAPEFAGSFRWPKVDERCIVTQVLDDPIHVGEHSSAALAGRLDVALAFVHLKSGEPMEFMHDSRKLVKVGSVFDPVKLPSGEEVPVE